MPAKIDIEFPMSKRLGSFLEYIKERVADPCHVANQDVIADFVDKFLVIEMKRLAVKDEVRKGSVEIPDDVLLEPLRNAKGMVDKMFRNLLGDHGAEELAKARPATPEESSLHTGQVDKKPTLDEIEKEIDEVPATPGAPAAPAKKSGNGHVAAKVNNLSDPEKDLIRAEFIRLNGEIAEDSCLPIRDKCRDTITIFQVTGFVTYLHKKVADGSIMVNDVTAYETYLQGHRKLWTTYDSAKYRAMRAKP